MVNRREFIAASSGVVGGVIIGGPRTLAQSDSSASAEPDAVSASRAVLARLLPNRISDFNLQWIPLHQGHETYVVSAVSGRVEVKGSSGVALCRGIYAYFRETRSGMVGWGGRRLDLPARLPDLSERRVVCPYKFIQYYNVCTFGYTTAFWNWDRWERELDWMALHGITMPLAMEGQEAIWQRVWKEFGVTQAELDRYFTGPAYLPWHRMGNIDYFEGPLPQGWIDQKRDLQRRILDRMRELGMSPVVPAFAGFIPEAFKRLYPQAKVFTELWTSQTPRQSKSLILDPRQDDLYKEIGAQFIREYKREFGSVEYYLADTFNEISVPVGLRPEEDLARFAYSVYASILAGDPNGKWVMQGWLFRSDPRFWNNRAIAAFLSGVPNDRMVILDFSNDSNADKKGADPIANNVWKDHESFFGKPWINGMIHTFGGNNNVKGNLPLIATQPGEVLATPQRGNLVGWGMDPEGIENNEVVYELMTDIGWSDTKIDLDCWIPEYCQARYGDYPPAMIEAWHLLLASAYSWHPTWNSRHAWQSRPSLEPAATGVDATGTFHQAVERFLASADQLKLSVLYRNDLIELVVQSVGGRIDAQLLKACQAHKAGQVESRDRLVKRALDMLLRVDGLMNLRVDRRLETWTGAAQSWALSPDEKAYYDRDSRRVITYWGWTDLNDYASRVWSGLIRDYYVGRWRAFFEAVQTNRPPALDVWEEAWLLAPYVPSTPMRVGDILVESRHMLEESKAWG
jgi:alpha-N-acetylglucosaminidase